MSEYVARRCHPNGIVDYTPEDDFVWNTLIERQDKVVEKHACQEFLEGLEKVKFSRKIVPQIPDINRILKKETGWSTHPVDAVIPADEFFTLLANKQFPAATFVRRMEDLDYLQEPDLFHEFYGHCPLLTHQAYADYCGEYGKLALSAPRKYRKYLFRAFWFTIEFGLIRNNNDLKIYGGGILSSFKETQSSVVASDNIHRKFDLLEVLRTPFRIDIVQPLYYIIEDMNEMYSVMNHDILKVIDEAKELGDEVPQFSTRTDSKKVPLGI